MKIVRAAILVDGEVWSVDPPGRHGDIIRKYCRETGELYCPHTNPQGFVTDTGEFVGRAEAAKIAKAAGQIKTEKAELYSEDLW